MRRIALLAAAGCLALGLTAVVPPPAAKALPVGAGYWAHMYASTPTLAYLGVFPKGGGYEMEVFVGNCQTSQKIPLLDFVPSAKLKRASVHAQTACGLVSVTWEAAGNLEPYSYVPGRAGVLRDARASGYMGGRFVSTPCCLYGAHSRIGLGA